MSDFQNDMNQTVQSFVAQITELARRAAINTLDTALNGHSATNGAVASSKKETAKITQDGRGAKRSLEDLAAISRSFADYVKANPGLRIEQINKALGTTTKSLALPIRKLIADGVIKVKGQKRSTTYFVGKKASN